MMAKKYWNDQTRNITIGSIIGGILLGIIMDLYTSIPAFLGSDVTMPIWLVALIGLPLLFLSSLSIKSILTDFYSTDSDIEPAYSSNYDNDHILGIKWGWNWELHTFTKEYDIYNLKARCPKCKSLLDINNYGKLVDCKNYECNWEWSNPNTRSITREFQLLDYVKKEIDRKVQTDEWKSANV